MSEAILELPSGARELERRKTADSLIRVLWSKVVDSGQEVDVIYLNIRPEGSDSLFVEIPPDKVTDALEHPYAYAAGAGFATEKLFDNRS